MCIIAVKSKGYTILDSTIKTMWRNNPDGGGFMWADPEQGKVHIQKFMELDEFLEYYYLAVQELDNPRMVLHFRIGTTGLKNLSNCHPHRVNTKLAFVHNGMLKHQLPIDTEISDTVWMNEVLFKQTPNLHLNKQFRAWLGVTIGNNKIVFLDHNGKVYYVNKSLGNRVVDQANQELVWYSNDTWKEMRKKSKFFSSSKLSGWKQAKVIKPKYKASPWDRYNEEVPDVSSFQALTPEFEGFNDSPTMGDVLDLALEEGIVEKTIRKEDDRVDYCTHCSEVMDIEYTIPTLGMEAVCDLCIDDYYETFNKEMNHES